jgi:hypothetical protein
LDAMNSGFLAEMALSPDSSKCIHYAQFTIPNLQIQQIQQKDFYRLLKAETNNEKYFKKLNCKEFGRCEPRTFLVQSLCKYKGPQREISEQFQKGALPEDRLYMIDKVVRLRGLHGRFGIDHSEVLNYEIE